MYSVFHTQSEEDIYAVYGHLHLSRKQTKNNASRYHNPVPIRSESLTHPSWLAFPASVG